MILNLNLETFIFLKFIFLKFIIGFVIFFNVSTWYSFLLEFGILSTNYKKYTIELIPSKGFV